MNRQVRLARTRNRLRKFSEFGQLEESSETYEYHKERVCLISNSSDDLQGNCESSSKSCSSLITVHGRLGGSVEVNCVCVVFHYTHDTRVHHLGAVVFCVVCLPINKTLLV